MAAYKVALVGGPFDGQSIAGFPFDPDGKPQGLILMSSHDHPGEASYVLDGTVPHYVYDCANPCRYRFTYKHHCP